MALRFAPSGLLIGLPLIFLLLAAPGCGGTSAPGAAEAGAEGGAGLTTALLAEICQYEDRRTPVAQRFEEFTAHADPAVRRRAALALGRIGDPRSAPLLLRLLGDVDPDVRGEAVFAAGLAGDPALIDAVRGLLQDENPTVQGLAVQTLLRHGTAGDGAEALAGLLMNLAGDTGEGGPLDAILGNAWRLEGDHGLFRDLLQRRAAGPADAGERERLLAIYSLARQGNAASASLFIRLLADADPAVRAMAAKGLGAAGSDSGDPAVAGAALANDLTDEEHWLVRVESFTALGRLRAALDPQLLCRALADEHPQVQTAAIRASGRMSDVGEEPRRWLATLLGALEPGVAPDAAEALARLGDPRGLAWGLEAARSPDPLRRVHAAAVLVHFSGEDDARSSLRVLFGDESGVVVRGALTAVAGAGRVADFQEDVTRTLIDGTEALTRAAAAEALGSAEDPEASLPLLIAADRREARQKVPDCRLSILGLLAGHQGNDDVARAVFSGWDARARRVRQRADTVITGWGRGADIPPGACEARGKPPLNVYQRAASLFNSRVEAFIDTAGGTVRIELLPKDAPLTVLNFLDLATEGYFDGICFHRVVPGFVVQGGDPEGDGWGGPGHTIRCEYNRLEYDRGMVGMALSGKDTGGSQFFITLAPQPHLNGRYTIFGRVLEGMDVVDRIRRGERITTVRLAVDPA
jgi:cyclophilin family peptidyl-prolyl cis-trans isomerase/HEAT repeat protein